MEAAFFKIAFFLVIGFALLGILIMGTIVIALGSKIAWLSIRHHARTARASQS